MAFSLPSVTCSHHAFSYSFQLADFVRLLGASVYPCDAVVCLTRGAREAMAKRLTGVAEQYCRAWGQPAPLPPRLEVIPWGIDTQRFAPRDRALARRDLSLPPDREVVLCIGRLYLQSKFDWTPLLLAFERASRRVQRRPLFVLAGAGPAEYGQQLLGQAAQLGLGDSIRPFFNFPPACLTSLYAACDVFVSPSDSPSESFGLTILEAMACGRPVVASDWDGYRELIVHGETGFKVRTDWADCLGELNALAPLLPFEQEHLHVGQSVSVDVAQMALYLVRLLDNRPLREEMGQRGRARVEALYDWEGVVEQWLTLWGELAAIARSVEAEERDRLDYLQPNYLQHFGHYAARIIDDAVPVRLTERGKELLAGRAPLFLHRLAQGFLRPDCLEGGLRALAPAKWLGTSLPVGKLLDVLCHGHEISRDCAMMHLMWLAKYDLVSLGGAGTPPDEPPEG